MTVGELPKAHEDLPDDDDLSTWTTEALRSLEEYLYDQEVAGEDTWFQRDQILWELNWRDRK